MINDDPELNHQLIVLSQTHSQSVTYQLFFLLPINKLGNLVSVRRKEINQIMKSSYLRGLNMASFFAGSKVIVFVTFTAYALLGNAVSASHVFVTVSLFGTIKLTVTLFLPLAVEKLSESLVSVRRIQVLLRGEALHEGKVIFMWREGHDCKLTCDITRGDWTLNPSFGVLKAFKYFAVNFPARISSCWMRSSGKSLSCLWRRRKKKAPSRSTI